MVTAQPSTGGLQEGGRPEPCPVSTGPGDRDSQACVPISVPQHWPEPSGSRSGPNVDFGPTWSSTQVPGYQGPGLVGRGGGFPCKTGAKKKAVWRAGCCVSHVRPREPGGVNPEGCGPQLGGHAFLATSGPESSGVLQNLTSECCLVPGSPASGPVANSSPGQAPCGAQLWREGTSSGRTPVSPQSGEY